MEATFSSVMSQSSNTIPPACSCVPFMLRVVNSMSEYILFNQQSHKIRHVCMIYVQIAAVECLK